MEPRANTNTNTNTNAENPQGGPGSSTLGFRTFGEYSQFLRSAMADEELLQLSEGLQAIAIHIEQVAGLLRAVTSDPTAIARGLVELRELLGEHGHLVQNLGADWHTSYEFKAHLRALAHFRGQLTGWASDVGPPGAEVPDRAEFELSAWRLLGAGALLLDAIEEPAQKSTGVQGPQDTGHTSPWIYSLWLYWWRRLLTVLHFKP